MLLVLLSWHATRLDVTSVCHIQSGFLHRRWRESVTEWGFPSAWGATLDTHHRPAVSHDALQCSVELLVRKNPSVLFFLVKKCCPVLTHCRHRSVCIVAAADYKLAVTFCFCHNETVVSLVLLEGCWLVQFVRPDFRMDLWKIPAWNQTDSAALQGCWIASLSHITVTEICK